MIRHALAPVKTAMIPPILFVAGRDRTALAAVESALSHRFGSDYRVRTAASVVVGIDDLDRFARDGDEVALVVADLCLPGTDGIEFLEHAHASHPGAARALLVERGSRGTRIPFAELASLQRATALGRIDFWLVRGLGSAEEWLYPQIQEALTAWTKANRPRHEVARVVGEQWASRSHELRDVLARNTVPFGFYAPDSAEGRALLGAANIDASQLPVVIFQDGSVLHDPSPTEVADALGVQTHAAPDVYDLAIVGAGPAGLTAAVYGASEGLRTVVIEPQAIGGQAGTSSMIRNYPGFPRGISGGDLSFRSWEQSLLFGAEYVFGQAATELSMSGSDHLIALADGSEARARSVIVASGVAYRRLGIPSLERYVGVGLFYGAAGVEAQAMSGEEVYVVGGANSAGQAALHLAKYAANVTVLVRGDSLKATMSEYLITQIAATPNIDIRLRTRVVDGHGGTRLEAVTLEDVVTARRERVPTAAIFAMIGAEARTDWLPDDLDRDRHGFILTGVDVPTSDWPLARPSLPFETSRPGVFAVGDIRHGSVKRVAAAVGEASVAVGSVHRFLAETAGAIPAGQVVVRS